MRDERERSEEDIPYLLLLALAYQLELGSLD
jgi:hypothetical protein